MFKAPKGRHNRRLLLSNGEKSPAESDDDESRHSERAVKFFGKAFFPGAGQFCEKFAFAPFFDLNND